MRALAACFLCHLVVIGACEDEGEDRDTSAADGSGMDSSAHETSGSDSADDATSGTDSTNEEVLNDETTTTAETSVEDITVEEIDPADTIPDDARPEIDDAPPVETDGAAEDVLEPRPVRLGAACVDVADCGGDPATTFCIRDAFWTDGYCISFGCRVDVDCPQGGRCGFFNTAGELGTCVRACDAALGCERAEYACQDLDRDGKSECGPRGIGPGAVGDPCETLADCGGGVGARCLAVEGFGVPGGYCSLECVSDAGCTEGSLCQGRGPHGGGACQRACATDADCGSGQACADRDFDGRPECGRAGDGPLAQNATCVNAAECDTGPLGLCLGGANFGGHCSAVCTSDDECGAASHCASLEGRGFGYCLPDCDPSAVECPGASGCIDFDGDGRHECGPAANGFVPLGGRCQVATDCVGDEGTFCGYPDLLCTRFCVADEDCGVGAGCVDFGYGPSRQCRERCTLDTDCDPLLACVDFDGDGARECVAVGQGNTPLGGSCSNGGGCARGQRLGCRDDMPGGLCTRACRAGLACPAGSHCATVIAGRPTVCLLDCETDDACRQDEGWRCHDVDDDGVRECAPSGVGERSVGEACANVSDCGGGEDARCLTAPAAFGGVCSLACAEDQPDACGQSASCVALPGEPDATCLPSCGADDACRAGYACDEVAGAEASVCAYRCAADADCFHFRGTTTCDQDGFCVP